MNNVKKLNVFRPLNRRLLISQANLEEETPAGVLLPDDYTTSPSRYTLARVLSAADDCNFLYSIDGKTHVVVESHMIESIDVAGCKYDTVMENYVIGILEI